MVFIHVADAITIHNFDWSSSQSQSDKPDPADHRCFRLWSIRRQRAFRPSELSMTQGLGAQRRRSFSVYVMKKKLFK